MTGRTGTLARMSSDSSQNEHAPSDLNQPENLEEFGAPTPGEALVEGYNPYEYVLREGPDGLPVEVSPPWQAQDAAPIPLTPETVVCLPQPADKWNENGLPACRYYKRQRVHNPQAPDRPQVQRFCTVAALRGINGACMSLSDAGVYDCEFRDPPHARATAVLDMIDYRLVKKGSARLDEERRTGKVMGYRIFRTPEDVAAGRTTLDEGDVTATDLNRNRIDPLADDDPIPPTQTTGAQPTIPASNPDDFTGEP